MKRAKRYMSLLLVAAMLVSCFAGLSVTAGAASVAASDLSYNSGTRHQVCTELSEQAEAYYTGDYAIDNLLQLSGSDSKSSLKTMDSVLYQALHELMASTMTDSVTYTELTAYWPYTDASEGKAGTILFYSDIVEEAFNREHVWPKSHGSFLEQNAGCDLHHLRPTNSTVNSTRSSYVMGNVVDILPTWTTYSHNDGTPIWYNADFNMVEVADEIKGDVARIYLYVYCCWEQPNLFEDVASENLPPMDPDDYENNGERVIDNLETLLYWMEIDPVDTWEMSRNDLIETVQGNRNVFIDYPELAWLLFDEEVPVTYETPSGYAKENGVVKPVITAVSANEEQGTVHLINNIVVAKPAEGYAVDSYSVDSDDVTVTQKGNLFYVTNVTEDCTVTVSFVPRKSATVNYCVPEGIEVDGGEENLFVGDSITLPGVTGTVKDAEQDYVFLGWTELPVEYAETLPEDLHYVGDSYYVGAEDMTLYGLFYYKVIDETSEDKEYALVEEAPEDWSGEYCIISADNGTIMTNTLKGNAAGTNVYMVPDNITVENNAVKNPNTDYLYTLTSVEGTDYYYLQDSAGNYIGCTAGKVLTQVAAEEADLTQTAYYWAPTLNGLLAYDGTFGILSYNASAPRFTTYSGGQATAALFGETASTKTCYTSAQGHIHVYDEVVVEATCTEAGSITYTCRLCGDTYTEAIPAKGHDYVVTDSKSATCTAEGYTVYTCTVCGDTYTDKLAIVDCASAEYVDVPLNQWYHNDVDAMIDAGLMVGVSNTRFDPNGTLQRAVVATVVYRMEGKPETNTDSPFTDVENGQWYTAAICWAENNSIVSGMGSTFEPKTAITREQLVAILYRYAYYKHYDTTEKEDISKYTDVNSVADYAKDAMAWAVAKGVVVGFENANGSYQLQPKGNATRAQFAAIVNRFQKKAAVECDHVYEPDGGVSPSCTECGYDIFTCKYCHKMYSVEIPPLGHNFTEWVITVEPTATSEGEMSRRCLRCPEGETQTIAKLDYTLTLTDTLKDGDQILIYSPSGNVLLSNIPVTAPYIQRLDDVSVTVKDGAINMLPEGAALVTVSINENGEYSFKLGDQYLVCNSGSGSLYFSDTPTFNKWVLEETDGGWMLRNTDSVKMYNGTPVPVYVEYYSGNFTSYYITDSTTDYSAFTFQFFRYEKTDG